jgi:hypothetical protein
MTVTKRKLLSGLIYRLARDPQFVQPRSEARTIRATVAVDQQWLRSGVQYFPKLRDKSFIRLPGGRKPQTEMPDAVARRCRDFVIVPWLSGMSAP